MNPFDTSKLLQFLNSQRNQHYHQQQQTPTTTNHQLQNTNTSNTISGNNNSNNQSLLFILQTLQSQQQLKQERPDLGQKRINTDQSLMNLIGYNNPHHHQQQNNNSGSLLRTLLQNQQQIGNFQGQPSSKADDSASHQAHYPQMNIQRQSISSPFHQLHDEKQQIVQNLLNQQSPIKNTSFVPSADLLANTKTNKISLIQHNPDGIPTKSPTKLSKAFSPSKDSQSSNDEVLAKRKAVVEDLQCDAVSEQNSSITDSTSSKEIASEDDGTIDKRSAAGQRRLNKLQQMKMDRDPHLKGGDLNLPKKRKVFREDWSPETLESESFLDFVSEVEQVFKYQISKNEKLFGLLEKFKWNKDKVIDNIKKNKGYYKKFLQG